MLKAASTLILYMFMHVYFGYLWGAHSEQHFCNLRNGVLAGSDHCKTTFL